MDELSKLAWRMSLAGVAVAAIASLVGCNESPPPAPPPPPAAAYQPPPPPPPLLGAPPERQFTAMAPIPNPPEHGHGAHHGRHLHGDHSPGWWLRAHGYKAGAVREVIVTNKPVVTPPPKVVAATPPVAAPPPVAKPSPLTQLASAVSDKWKGATLSAPADLSAKKPGAVTLSLPADLLTAIRQEAAKLGLGKAAKKAEITATLHGDGYTVTPPGPQTAPLLPGKPTTFTWQVAPGPNAKGPLTADVNAVLKGAGEAQSFTLAKLKQAVDAVDAAVKAAEASHGFKFPSLDMLSIPGHKDVALPVVGKTPSKSIVGALIVLAILLVLILLARGASGRRESENQRRRYRTMASASPAVGLAEPEPHVEHVLAPAVEHAHATEQAVAHAHEADAHDAAPGHYEEPHMSAQADDQHAADHHADAAPVVDHHADAHPADDHAVADAHVADHAHDDHAAPAEAHAAEDHAPADQHAALEPVVDHNGEAPVGDYVPIGDHGDAHDGREVVHVAEGHTDAHADDHHGEDHAGDHAADDHAADGHAHDDHHHGHDEHRPLALESL